MLMHERSKYSDVVLFVKVVSSALLVGGYIVAGYAIGKKLTSSGYPSWTQAVLSLAGALLGMHQGYRFLKEHLSRSKEKE